MRIKYNGHALTKTGLAGTASFSSVTPEPLPILAPNSIRVRYTLGVTPSFSKGTGSLVSASKNIWDLDLTGIYDLGKLFYNDSSLVEIIEHSLTLNISKCQHMLGWCINVIGGFYQLYQYLSGCACGARASLHQYAFYACGTNTETGSAELAEIPDRWK